MRLLHAVPPVGCVVVLGLSLQACGPSNREILGHELEKRKLKISNAEAAPILAGMDDQHGEVAKRSFAHRSVDEIATCRSLISQLSDPLTCAAMTDVAQRLHAICETREATAIADADLDARQASLCAVEAEESAKAAQRQQTAMASAQDFEVLKQAPNLDSVQAFEQRYPDFGDKAGLAALRRTVVMSAWNNALASRDLQRMREVYGKAPELQGRTDVTPKLQTFEATEQAMAALDAAGTATPPDAKAVGAAFADAAKKSSVAMPLGRETTLNQSACVVAAASEVLKADDSSAWNRAIKLLSSVRGTDAWPCSAAQSDELLRNYAGDFGTKHRAVEDVDQAVRDVEDLDAWSAFAKGMGLKKSTQALATTSTRWRKAVDAELAREKRVEAARQARIAKQGDALRRELASNPVRRKMFHAALSNFQTASEFCALAGAGGCGCNSYSVIQQNEDARIKTVASIARCLGKQRMMYDMLDDHVHISEKFWAMCF